MLIGVGILEMTSFVTSRILATVSLFFNPSIPVSIIFKGVGILETIFQVVEGMPVKVLVAASPRVATFSPRLATLSPILCADFPKVKYARTPAPINRIVSSFIC